MTPDDYLGDKDPPPKAKWVVILIEAIHWSATLFAFMCAILFLFWSFYVTTPRAIDQAATELPTPTLTTPP